MHDINKRVQIGLGLTLLESNKHTIADRFRIGNNKIEINISSHALMLFVEPTVKIRSNIGKSSVYGSLGPSIGLLGRIKVNTQIISPEVSKSEFVMDKGIAWGLASSLGLSVPFSKRFAWFIEHKVRVSSYAPKRGRLLKYIQSEVDLLPDQSRSTREVVFVNKRSTVENVPIDPTKPSTQLKIFYPFSSIGLQAGFIFRL